MDETNKFQSEENLIKICAEVDEFIIKLSTANEVGFPDVCAVIVARMKLICQSMDQGEELNILLNYAASKLEEPESKENTFLH